MTRMAERLARLETVRGVASVEALARAERVRQDADEFVRRIETLSARAAEQVRSVQPGPDAYEGLTAILDSMAARVTAGGRHAVV